ncbi:hypothetical protein Esti_005939 [Eimeria stiedai]
MDHNQYPETWPPVLSEAILLETLRFAASIKTDGGALGGALPSTVGSKRDPFVRALEICLSLKPDVLYLLAHNAPAQPADREAALAALQAHMRNSALTLERAPHTVEGGAPVEGPLNQGILLERPPAQRSPQSSSMELRFFAFRSPLASQQDTDFFVGLLHAAERPSDSARKGGERVPLAEGSLQLHETTAAEAPSATDPERHSGKAKTQRNKQEQRKGAAATPAAAAAAMKEEQQAASQFVCGPLPPNFVTIDWLGFKLSIAKDEKRCSALLARLQMAKELSDSEQKLQDCVRDLRKKLHTEIALIRVIANDGNKASP